MTVNKVPQYDKGEFEFRGKNCTVRVKNEEIISESKCILEFSGITIPFTLGQLKFYENGDTYLGAVKIKGLPFNMLVYLCRLKGIHPDNRFEDAPNDYQL